MKKQIMAAMLLLALAAPGALADEGMWIPVLIEKYNIKLMQENGFKLTAEDIYSINKASMKDAVVLFGGGCTGEFISDKGLIITNHHCGYGYIHRHSTLEHDYLTDGFWAASHAEELPNPGLSVTILKYMEDVTDRVLQGVTDNMESEKREAIINANITAINAEAVKGTHYLSAVRPFYLGNQYFLIVNEVFRDVRLVGAPPSAIGKFGGDTDNWVWPRHTGDFSLFRVYADKENNPAAYSADNLPYHPAYHFPVSLAGVKEGDFTMVFGYPGRTQEYAPSHHIRMLKDVIYPKQVEIRGKKISIMEQEMANDPLVRLKYTGKSFGLANGWKKWIGEIQSLDRMNGVERKEASEKEFSEWVSADPGRTRKYGNILSEYAKIYEEYTHNYLVAIYTNEVFGSTGVEPAALAGAFNRAVEIAGKKDTGQKAELEKELQRLSGYADNFFRNFDMNVSKQLFVAVMELYGNNIGSEWQTDAYRELASSAGGDFESVADRLFARSLFTDEAKVKDLINNFNPKKVEKDPFYRMALSSSELIRSRINEKMDAADRRLAELNKLYMAAQMEKGNDKIFYPDANSTLRLAYGKVMGYDSRDAVYHKHQTTLTGVMEKDNPEIYDYDVPDRLRELYEQKDFGRYAVNGDVPVCFIANNHTTGGNSGSPVLNAEGHLIGVNFDRAWEGVASDIMFNPKQSRNISLDIRYALFLIDKFAGAGYLIDEMTLVGEPQHTP
ncbi:MAG TPA: S46 family peptidase [Bacteroidales bacterium]|nr:S46 family peptidase [Bacteroidales bacterium]